MVEGRNRAPEQFARHLRRQLRVTASLTIMLMIVACGDREQGKQVKMKQDAQEALELGGFVLAHAIWKADGEIGESVVPFSMTVDREGRKLQVYDTDRLEEGVAMAQESLLQMQPTLEAWALAYETVNTRTGEELITVDIWDKRGFTARIHQQYFPRTNEQPFSIAGRPLVFVGDELQTDEFYRAAVMKGIESHERARGYWMSR